MLTFIRTIERAIGDPDNGVILVEGFLLFNNDSLTHLFDRQYLMHVELEHLLERRNGRMYELKDAKDTDFWIDPPGYVEEVVYPMYLHHHRHFIQASSQNNMTVLNSSLHDLETLGNLILEDLKTQMVESLSSTLPSSAENSAPTNNTV